MNEKHARLINWTGSDKYATPEDWIAALLKQAETIAALLKQAETTDGNMDYRRGVIDACDRYLRRGKIRMF